MKNRFRIIVALSSALALTPMLAATASAEPGGCLKYRAVGGIGGHFVGHHAVLGAAGGLNYPACQMRDNPLCQMREVRLP